MRVLLIDPQEKLFDWKLSKDGEVIVVGYCFTLDELLKVQQNEKANRIIIDTGFRGAEIYEFIYENKLVSWTPIKGWINMLKDLKTLYEGVRFHA